MVERRIVEFSESHRTLSPNMTMLRGVKETEPIEASIYLKPREDLETLPAGATERRAAVQRHRATQHRDDILLVLEFARVHDLSVTAVEAGRRLVKVAGPASRMQAAFGVSLGIYTDGLKEFRSYEGTLHLPEDLLQCIESVLGFDSDPAFWPLSIPSPSTASSRWPSAYSWAYSFPTGVDGSGQCIALLEFGGGFLASDTATACADQALSTPTVVTVSVDGAEYDFAENPDSQEVALDIQVVCANAPGATIAVYFAPNTSQGMVDAITQAANDTTNNPSVISISWGNSEALFAQQAVNSINSALQDAGMLGVSVLASSGDLLATNGLQNDRANVLLPSSSPWAIGCGGTSRGTTDEVVWNNDGTSGTGGGISDVFAVPSFQAGTNLPPSVNDGQYRRGVPDVAGNADPNCGYLVIFNGNTKSYGGTSAVAPLWAALTALINEAAPSNVGFFLPRLYTNSQPMQAITEGNNKPWDSNLGYAASSGWSACTGLGVPNGGAVLTLLARPGLSLGKAAVVRCSQSPWLRVYYQSLSAVLYENVFSRVGSLDVWGVGATLPSARSGGALAAVSWEGGNNETQVRVYYQDGNNMIQEYSLGAHWGQGASLQVAAPGSALAAVTWDDGNGTHIRVYYLDTTYLIQEYCWDSGSWNPGSSLATAAPYSALTALTWQDGNGIHIRVYYQDANNVIQEYCLDSSWYPGSSLVTAPPGISLAAVAWQDNSGTNLRIYYQDASNVIQEKCWNAQWSQGSQLPLAIQDSLLAGTCWMENGSPQIRVLFQGTDGAIHEEAFSSETWGLAGCEIPVLPIT